MKIRFVNPPIWDMVGQHYRLNQAVGGPLLSAILEQNGHDACYVDGEFLKWTMDDVTGFIKREQPDAIGITATNLNAKGVIRMSRTIKMVAPQTYIAVGGPEATATPDAFKDKAIDCVVAGEADLIVNQVFTGKRKGFSAEKCMPMDLDALPVPNWRRSKPLPTAYAGNMPHFERPEACALWMRGCAHKCTFCSNPVFNRVAVRYRSPESIVQELWVLKSMGVNHVFVYSDELIGMSPKQTEWLMEVCEAIIKAKLGMTFKTQGRCSTHNSPEALKLMAKAGFKAVMWGIESMSPNVLQAIRKGITPDDVWHTLRESHKAGLMNWGFFMVGMPEEKAEDFRMTVSAVGQMLDEGILDWKQVNICTPSPGTELWKQAQDMGWLRVSDPTASGWFHQEAVMEMPYASGSDIKSRLRMLQAI